MTADKEVVNALAGAQQQTLTKLLSTGLPRRLSSSRKRCRSALQRSLGSSSLHTDELGDLGFVLVRALVALQGHIHDQVAVQSAASDVCLVALGAGADKCLLTYIGDGFARASRSLLTPLNSLLVRGRGVVRALVLIHGDHRPLRAIVGRVGHAA